MKKRPDTNKKIEELKSEMLTVDFLICETIIRDKIV
jgi:hypothetical protein